jgi:DNA polymerase (family 10)
MDNTHYARILNDVAALLELDGENRYRVRAFENAAQTIRRLSEPVEARIEAGTLEDLDGIGSSIASDIREIHETGSCEARESLLERLDPGLLDLLDIQGLGPKRLKTIYDELGIATIDGLREAAENDKLQTLSGIGPKTEQNILDEIERLANRSGRTPLPAARAVADSLCDSLRELPSTKRVEVAGSLRRGRETIGDIDLLVSTDDPEAVTAAFTSLPEVDEVLLSGDAKTSVRLMDGLQVDLRFIDESHYGAALHYFTGSKQHHVELRSRAKRDGLKVSEYGVFRQEDDERVAAATEQDVYEALGLPYIPPELREGAGEIEKAAAGELPALVEPDRIRGDLHMHTTETDGSASIREMAEAARDLGLEYIAITDHSEAVRVANGMTPDRLEKHIERIREVDDDIEDFRVLAGIEVDILTDGELDMDLDLLAECDWVVGSIHSQFDLDRQAMTDRLVRAVESDLVSCLGHPTGRILGGRDGYEYDFEAVLEAARDHEVALELNGSGGRLDLNAELARRAHDEGVALVAGSDAHSTSGLRDLEFAIQQARRAWLTAEDLLNTRPVSELTGATPPN